MILGAPKNGETNATGDGTRISPVLSFRQYCFKGCKPKFLSPCRNPLSAWAHLMGKEKN